MNDDLNLINQFRPVGAPEYGEGDIQTFQILASNNLLHANLFCWDLNSLKTMARTYPGKPLMLDHDWENVMAQMGFIYKATLLHYPSPSPQIQQYFLNRSPKSEIDQMIMNRDGLYQLVCSVATETSYPITNDLMFGRKINSSIGGLSTGEIECPLCKMSFEDPECPHYIPVSLSANMMDNAAPYWIRKGYTESFELSMVMAGNCPSAKVLNQQDAQILGLV